MSETKIQTKLTPGTYQCTKSLLALRGDKRITSDWRCQPILVGTLFFYTEWSYSPSDDDRTVIERRLYPVGKYSSESVSPDETLSTRQLVEFLIPVEETPALWVRREHGHRAALGVLDELFKTGKISMEEVQTAAANYMNGTNE